MTDLIRRRMTVLVALVVLAGALTIGLLWAPDTTPSVLINVPDVSGQLIAAPDGNRLHVAATIASGSGISERVRVIWYLGAPGDRRPWKHPAYSVPWQSFELAAHAVHAEEWDIPVPNLSGVYRLTVVVHLQMNGREFHATDASPTGPPLVLPQA